MTLEEAKERIVAGTGRNGIHDALEWIAEDRPTRSDVPLHELLGALVVITDQDNGRTAERAAAALKSLTRRSLHSAVDPSVELLSVADATRPGTYREALETLAAYTPSRSLRDVSATAVHAALADDSHIVETLCAVAGLSYRDLADRVSMTLPSESSGPWTVAQVDAAFAVLDSVVRGTTEPVLPGAVVARPVEMLFSDGSHDGWETVEHLRSHGVSYETLLAQRAVGGSWLAHRSSTASVLPALILDRLVEHLDAHELSYWRVGTGGLSKRAAAAKIARDNTIGQVTLIVHAEERPVLAIALSVARDGGTARKNAGKLKDLPAALKVPAAVIVIGPGWAPRGESLELIRCVEGRVFTDEQLADAADLAYRLACHSQEADSAQQ